MPPWHCTTSETRRKPRFPIPNQFTIIAVEPSRELPAGTTGRCMQDLRDAFRALKATPVVTAIAILSLALGIGANTAIFSILNSLMLRALPVREPQKLVMLADAAERRSTYWTNPIWEQIR